jgi:hypothetical protein
LPPFLGLSDAVMLTDKIYEQAGGQANYDLLSRIFDNTQNSSSFTKKLATLKAYGLVTEASKGEVSLTDSGLAIAAPQSQEASAMAKRDALLRIDVYSKIYERHKGKLLPADEFLKNIIEQDSGIPRELSDKWVKAFKDAVVVAGLLHDRGDGRMQLMESALVVKTPSVVLTAKHESFPQIVSPSVEKTVLPSTAVPIAASGMNIKIQLSDGQLATFCVPDKIGAKDAQKLKNALEGFGRLIDSLVDGSN